MLDNPFRPPTYNHDGSVAAAAAAQSYGGEQNVPLAMNQPAGGGILSPNRNVLIFHILFKALAVFVYLTAGLWGASYVLTFVLVTMLMAMGAPRRAWRPRLVSARPLPSSFLRLCCCLSHYCCRCRADFWTVKKSLAGCSSACDGGTSSMTRVSRNGTFRVSRTRGLCIPQTPTSFGSRSSSRPSSGVFSPSGRCSRSNSCGFCSSRLHLASA